jgi:hypothetical protein
MKNKFLLRNILSIADVNGMEIKLQKMDILRKAESGF